VLSVQGRGVVTGALTGVLAAAAGDAADEAEELVLELHGELGHGGLTGCGGGLASCRRRRGTV